MSGEEAEIQQLIIERNAYVLQLTELNAALLKHTQIHSGLQVHHLDITEHSEQDDAGCDQNERLEKVLNDQRDVEDGIGVTEQEISEIEQKILAIDRRLSELNNS